MYLKNRQRYNYILIFRYMAAGKHIGKVLLKIRDEEPEFGTKPQILMFDAVPRYLCSNSDSFILCGECNTYANLFIF